jgi:hypothetical protein
VSSDSTAEQSSPLAVATAAAALTALFLAPWWNRFLGLTLDGYMPFFGHLILGGAVPYRDFFLHLPPLHPLFDAALEALFGRSFLAIRIAGAAGRLALAALTAAWLARRFSPRTSLVASLAAVWLASGDDTEILDLYNHHALLAAIGAGFLASKALAARGRSSALWIAAGVLSAVAFWTKQTIGLASTAAIPVVLALLAVRGAGRRREHLRGFGLFSLGWSIPSILLTAWLASQGAWSAFIRQVFLDASASKGPLAALVWRPWLDPFGIPELQRAAWIGAAIALLAMLSVDVTRVRGREGRRGAVGYGIVLALCAVVAGHLVTLTMDLDLQLLRDLQRIGVFAAIYGIAFAALRLFWRAMRRPPDPRERELLVMVTVSGAAAASVSLSWPAGEAIALPSLALVLALALEAAPIGRWSHFTRAPLLLGATLAVVAAVALKLLAPFDFAQWSEPRVNLATEVSELRELRGLRLSKRTRAAIDRSVLAIRRATDPGEPIYTHSLFPIINFLADRPLATFAAVHWPDVTPDRVVDAERIALLASPPLAVVRQHVGHRMLRIQEIYFRSGRPSALRRLGEELDAVLSEQYVLVASNRANRFNQPPLQVWVRADRATERGLPEVEDDDPRKKAR